MKQCGHCKKEKPYELFQKNKSSKDGYHWWCKTCNNAYQKAQYPKRKEQIKARTRKHYQENIEHHHAQKRGYYKDKVAKIFSLLGESCERCGNEDKRVLQVDHVNGGGGRHRKSKNGSWWMYFKDILVSIESGKNDYKLLCVNCNWIEGIEKGYRKSIWS